MPFPTGTPTKRVHLTVTNPTGGAAATGSVRLAPNVPAIVIDGTPAQFTGSGAYQLDAQGRLVDTDGTTPGVELLDNSAAGNPTGWLWQAIVTVGGQPRTFYFTLAGAPDDVDLAELQELNPGAPKYVAVPGPRGLPGTAGVDGSPGQSAYQAWLANGHTGTEAEFLAALRGPAGQDGTDGEDGDQGAAGASAYQVAQAAGFPGTQAEWLASLAGPQGQPGAAGATGATGATGAQGPKGDTGSIGPEGPAGPKGDTGDQGPAGPEGPAGSGGASIVSRGGRINREIITLVPVAGWAIVTTSGGIEIGESVPANVGDRIWYSPSFLRTYGVFLDMGIRAAGGGVSRYTSSNGPVPEPDGYAPLYPEAAFAGVVGVREFVVQAGEIDGSGNATIVLAYRGDSVSSGTQKVYFGGAAGYSGAFLVANMGPAPAGA